MTRIVAGALRILRTRSGRWWVADTGIYADVIWTLTWTQTLALRYRLPTFIAGLRPTRRCASDGGISYLYRAASCFAFSDH